MTTTTPDMNLVLPDVSVTAGPQWATLLNAAFTAVDSHDHSTGKGMKVTPSGLNISSDLSFVQNNATDLRSLRLYPNSIFTAGVNDKTCVYSLNGDLYYIDNTGVSIRITNNGTVDVNGAIQTLSIKDTGLFIQYFGDTTRQFRFDASAIPASTARVISMPDSGANDTLVTVHATQTITNKTLTTPILNNPSIANYANLSNSSAPATPGAGSSNIYVSNVDNQLHLVSSAGVDTAIGASSSSGKNYLQTYYGFALNPVTNAATSLTVTGNRTASQGFFGTSSAVASTLLAYNTSSPLRAPGDLQFIIPSASSGVFIESPMFTLDAIDVNAGVQFISFEMNAATTGAAAGDALVSVIQYDSSGSYVQTIQPSITQLPSGYYKFKAAFSPVSTASAKYSIRFTANTASARTLDIQNIIVGPQYAVAADAVGGWVPYTPTFSAGFGTISNASALYRRVGDSMEIIASCTVGTVAASIASISLPSAFTIDSSKLTLNNSTSTSGSVLGVWAENGNTNSDGLVIAAPSTSTSVVYLGLRGATYLVPMLVNAGIVSTNVFSFRCIIPIAQWTSTVTLAGNANIEYVSNSSGITAAGASNTTSFASGANGAIIGSIDSTTLSGGSTTSFRVRFQSPIQPTDRLVVEVQEGINGVWVPASYRGVASVFQGTAVYGVYAVSVNNTDATVNFGNGGAISNGATYGGASLVSWSTLAGWKWRVAKYSAVGLAELAPATATSQGSISRENVWTPYTSTTAGFGTTTSTEFFYKVIGDSLFIRARLTTGVTTASFASASLPTGFTINTSKIPNGLATTATGGAPIVGQYAASVANQSGFVLVAGGSSNATIYFGGPTTASTMAIPQQGGSIFSNSAIITFQCEVPLV